MILAVAGHVDHGKTALVQALTGVDTDRLPEEKRRGMTIEPGHAVMPLPGGGTLNLVDVPGHQGFLRQAIAGLAASTGALLVVACDDGPMPQTHEHLVLMRLLGTRGAAVVLTKCDRADPQRRAERQAELALLVRGSPLEQAPVFTVSARTGEGLEALRAGLVQLYRRWPAPPAQGGFRLAVDRSFSRPGAGTVVTGTVLSGRVVPGDAVCVSSSGQRLRVRAVQRNGSDVTYAQAGQRCALALPGAEREALARGVCLLVPWLLAPTRRVDAVVTLLPHAPRGIDGHADLQLHLGAATAPARVLALQPPRLAPGQRGWVQLLLGVPVSALHGDRLVLRDPAAQALVGGGRVLDDAPPARGRATQARIDQLYAMDEDDPRRAMDALMALRTDGVDAACFARQRNLDGHALAALQASLACQVVPTPAGPHWLAAAHWEALHAQLLHAVDAWHAQQPSFAGITESALWRALQGPADRAKRAVQRAALQALIAEGRLARTGWLLHQPGHRAELPPQDRALLQQVQALLQPMGLRPLPLGDLAARMAMPMEQAGAALAGLAASGHIVQVAKNRFFLPQTLHQLMQVARDTATAAHGGTFDAADFRDRSGVGRNLSIQLLEFFDRIRFTRFDGRLRRLAETLAPADTESA